MSKSNEWKWHGHAQHLCVSNQCHFHLGTELPNGYMVSTVGDWFPSFSKFKQKNPERNDNEGSVWESDKGEDVGLDRKFETMVFPIVGYHECGCPKCNFSEFDMDGYNTHREAIGGHMKMCQKWAKKKKFSSKENEEYDE